MPGIYIYDVLVFQAICAQAKKVSKVKKKMSFLKLLKKQLCNSCESKQKCKKKYSEKNILFYKGLSINMILFGIFNKTICSI